MKSRDSKKNIIFYYFTDLVIFPISWIIAIFIRFMLLSHSPREFYSFLMMTLVPTFLAAVILYHDKSYRSAKRCSWTREFTNIIILDSKVQIFFLIVLYNIRTERISRLAILLFFFTSLLFLIISRLIRRDNQIRKRAKGKDLEEIILIGNGKHINLFAKKVLNSPLGGYKIIGWVDSNGVAEKMGIPSYCKEVEDKIVEDLNPRSVVLGYSNDNGHLEEKYIKTHYDQIRSILLLPNINYALIGANFSDFMGEPLIGINQPCQDHFALGIKRLIDVIGSAFGLIILSPLLLIIAILVKLTSKGPIFYGQERMTLDGKIFKMWKFRSMKQDADKEEGFTWTVENDPRRTKFGTFLRKTSLDEFPQLWNVLIGDMSLVGPRPERPELIENFKTEIPGYMLRHKMRTGITGWAQINGWRGNTSLVKRIEFDIYYIRTWSNFLDFKILFLTIFNGFVNKNAY